MKGVSTHSLVTRQQFGDSVPLVQGISNDYRDPGSHTACSRVRSWSAAARCRFFTRQHAGGEWLHARGV